MTRSVVTIDDLTNDEIEAIFQLADRFLDEMGTPDKPYRIRGRFPLAHDYILAALFYEPSTRTRLSFESAIIRLGGRSISSADANTSSVAKGETIADTVRVVENYADILVIRHPCEGAARVAADFADIPVINAGDGSHEHPTQTLCDLYTLCLARKGASSGGGPGALKDMNVVLWGDLKHGRTVHSLAYALARFGAHIIPLAAPGCEIPEHVRHRLARDYQCFPLSKKDIEALPDNALPADVIYVTPEEPHQLALWPPDVVDVWIALSKQQQSAIKGIKTVDAFYSTRLQQERLDPEHKVADYPVVDANFLKEKRYRETQVMHPLPRAGELSYDMDRDPRGVYFKQAAYGVPVRMALIASLLELQPCLLTGKAPSQSRYQEYGHPDGVPCGNSNCVTRHESEHRYLSPRFWIVDQDRLTIRCVYCDHEQRPGVVSRGSTKKYTTTPADFNVIDLKDLVLFVDEQQAIQAGHERKKTPRRTAAGADQSPTRP